MKNNFYLNQFLKKGLQSWALYSMTFVLLITVFASRAIAGSGIFESYVVFNSAFYDLQNPTANPDFQGNNLGTFTASTNFTLGGEIKTFKNGSDNICGGNIWYSIYPAAGSPGVFTNVTLPFFANLVTPGDQQWRVTPGTSIAFPAAPGSYKIAVYVTDIGDGSGGCTLNPFHTSNNGGSYWVADFSLCGSGIGPLPSGTYAIPGCFATVQSAVSYINTNGVAGAVTFAVAAGHTETAPNGGITITATGTSINTITFVKNGVGTNPTITANSLLTSGLLHDAIIEIIGGDFITIDGFTLLENSANTTIASGTNNMTEWGVALLYASTTNGVQNCTIKNCTIDLNRTYPNTWGIYSNSTHSATVVSTSVTATTTAGSNSNLTIIGNTITDVNQGILIVGPTAAADNNDVLTIGGTLANANSITNWGTTSSFSGYANVSGTVNGILVRNTKNYNVSFNTLSSSNGGHTSGTNIRGIFIPSFTNSPIGTIINTINNNIISVRSAVIAATISGIIIESSTVNATTTQNINLNDFNTFGHTLASSGSVVFISNSGVSLGQNINTNTFTNLTLNTTGSVTFISNGVNAPTGGSKNVNGNSIVTAFSKTGAGGIVALYIDNASSVAGVLVNNNNNNFSNITVIGTTTIAGWANTDGGLPTKTITGNTFNNWTGGTGAIVALVASFGNTSNVSGNTVSNITSAGSINGIASSSSTQIFSGNTIHSLSTTGTSSTINGFNFTGGTTNTISKNKIYNLSGNQTGNIITGINITTGTTYNVDNNTIGDLRATTATNLNSIIGINASASSTYNIFYNTIRLDATSSSATTFGNSCISFSSTASAFNLRNNILINSSTPAQNGLNVASNGIAACLRRSSGTNGTVPANYAVTSNNNLYWCNPTAGTNNHQTYVEGIATTTNAKNTVADLKVFMVNRDQNSVEENSTFASTIGANSNFLHFTAGSSTLAESAAANVVTYLDDFDTQTRQGNPGYTGLGTAPDIGSDEFEGINPSFVPIDISPTALVSPFTTGCLTNAETVTVTIKNSGTSIVDFSLNPVVVTVNITGAVSQTLTASLNSGTLAIGATQNVNMSATLDMTPVGTYNFALNTNTTGDGNSLNDNLSGITRINNLVVTPQQVNFTGFTGENLTSVFPNWREGIGAATPSGTTSEWISSSVIVGSGRTAKINLHTIGKNEWIVGPKFLASSSTVLNYKIAITDFTLNTIDPFAMQGTDDKVVVKISTDCGLTYTDLFVHNAASTSAINNTLVAQSINLSAYAGQQVVIAFFATEGTVDNVPDYDFHIDDVFIGDLCSGTPTAGTAVANPVSFCGSGSSALTTTGMTASAGIAYSWYSSTTSGGPYTIINGANTTALNTGVIGTTTYYIMYTKCISNSDSVSTAEVSVTINPSVVAIITPNAPSICPGASITLTATPSGSGQTFLWSLGGATTDAITVSPTSTTTYSVLVTALSGCNNTTNTIVTVNPAPPITTGVSICAGGAGTISATASCSGFANAGTTLSGTFISGSDAIALRPTTSIINTSTCSFDGTITRNYQTVNFQVTATGLYTFDMTSADDGMAYITTGAFVPGNCLGGGTWIKGDDDTGPGNDPQLSMTLTVGITYTLVSTTYSSSSGTSNAAYTWSITPPSGQQIMLPFTGTLDWYTTSSGGTSIGSGSPFNPVGVLNSGLPNTNAQGTYTFYAACSGNSTCRTSADFLIKPLPTIAAVNGGASYCPGDVVANVTAAVTGVGPWTVTYTLNGGSPQTATGASSPISLGNAAGVYVVTNLADANCTTVATGTQTITINAAPTVSSVNGGATYCAGDVVANITATVAGASPWTVIYTLNGGSPQTATGASSPISLGNASGVYVVTNVTDANCTAVATGTQTITVNPLPTVTSVNGGATYCVGDVVTNVTAAVTGVSPWTVTYTLNGGSPQTATGTISPISLGNAAGVYLVTNLADANCTTVASGTQTIAINSAPTVISVNGGATYCAGDIVSNINTAVTGISPWTVTYTLNGGSPLTATGASSPISLGNAPGVYVVTNVTDANCTAVATGTQTITVNPLPTVTSVNGGASYCAGLTPSNITTAVTGIGPWTITYTLNGGSPLTATGASSPISLGNTPGTYSVTNVADANCFGTASGVQTITINPLPTGAISGTTTIANGANATLSFTFTGTPPFSYIYTDGTNNFGPFTSGSVNATKVVSPVTTTTYTLFSVTDNNTCVATSLTGSAVVTVTLYPLVQLASPYCGILNYNTNSALVSTVGVPSAGIIGYDWQFTELQSPFTVYTLITPNPGNGMLLYMFPQVQFGRTYSVKTRVRYAGNVTGVFGTACNIGLVAAPITQGAPLFNNGFFGYCSQINAVPVGGATNYKFVFTSVNPTITINRPNWALPLTFASGLLLGNTYTLNVYATLGGLEGTVSNPITINMNNFVPNTGMNPLINACGAVYSPNAAIQAVEVCNASSYTWRFKNTTQVQSDIIYTRVGGNRAILLSFPSGLIPGNSYDVDVKASSGGLNGDYSTVCNITIAGGNPGLALNSNEETIETAESKSLFLDGDQKVSIYPNPNNGLSAMISIDGLIDASQKIVVTMFDVFGKQIQKSSIANSGATFNSVLKFENDLTNGIYFINITANEKLISTERISIIK
jgi:trimeric autotransporter adhesin